MDKYIRFLLITGITKVSHVNIFSGLNQMNDISMSQNYSALCGISGSELDAYFVPEIEGLAEKQEMNIPEESQSLLKCMTAIIFPMTRIFERPVEEICKSAR